MEKFLDALEKINSAINGIVWGWPTIIMILGTGLLFTICLKAMQIRKLKESISQTIIPTIKSIGNSKQAKDKSGKSVSQFEAFCSAISGTVGTGNIIGTTSAILTGGPGAVFWMWISAFFGMITNYAENVLGLFFRKKNEDNEFSGGAFYYIAYGAKIKWLGIIAAIFCMFAAMGMGGVQNNKIASTLTNIMEFDSKTSKIIIGAIIATLVGLIIIGGIKRIGKIASILIPFMTILFICLALIGIFMNISQLGNAFGYIFKNAFTFKSMAGGFGGYAFSQIIKKGMARGVFSNEAGLGSSVIAHSASSTREPVKQGLWGIFEVFLDTFVICTLMALLFITTMLNKADFGSLDPNTMVDSSLAIDVFYKNFGSFGKIAFSIILPLFAFTTIMAWSYYGEKATEFLFKNANKKARKIATLSFKIIFLLFICFSSLISSNLIWDIDDTFNGLMAIPNLIALIILSKTVVDITRNYYDRKKGLNIKPMLSYYEDLNEEFIKDIENCID